MKQIHGAKQWSEPVSSEKENQKVREVAGGGEQESTLLSGSHGSIPEGTVGWLPGDGPEKGGKWKAPRVGLV